MVTLEMLNEWVKELMDSFPADIEVKLAMVDYDGTLVAYCDNFQIAAKRDSGVIICNNIGRLPSKSNPNDLDPSAN